MARLTPADNTNNSAAVATPEKAHNRRASSFRSLMSTLSGGTSSSSPATSPKTPSPLSRMENLEPGFDKVGLYPSEQVSALDLDDSSSYSFKLIMENETTSEPELIERDAVQEAWMSSNARANEKKEGEKARLVLGIDTGPVNKVPSTTDSSSIDNGDETANRQPIETSPRAVSDSHAGLRRSPPQLDLRSTAYEQREPANSASKVGIPRDEMSISASASPEQRNEGAIDYHKFLYNREGDVDIANELTDDVSSIATERAVTKVLEPVTKTPNITGHDLSLDEMVFKVGPFVLGDNAARALASISVFLPLAILFLAAFQGPCEFGLAAWRIGVCLVAYNVIRRMGGWDEDGSCDIVLAPAEELGLRMEEYGKSTRANFFADLTKSIVAACDEMKSRDNASVSHI